MWGGPTSGWYFVPAWAQVSPQGHSLKDRLRVITVTMHRSDTRGPEEKTPVSRVALTKAKVASPGPQLPPCTERECMRGLSLLGCRTFFGFAQQAPRPSRTRGPGFLSFIHSLTHVLDEPLSVCWAGWRGSGACPLGALSLAGGHSQAQTAPGLQGRADIPRGPLPCTGVRRGGAHDMDMPRQALLPALPPHSCKAGVHNIAAHRVCVRSRRRGCT